MESIDKQVSVLMRGSEFGDQQTKGMMTEELRQRLVEASNEGRPLRVYCGFDVTAPDIHLGHTIPMRKLRQFQDFGHEVTFVIGTFTTLIGDPSDRDEARSASIAEQIEQNAKTYTEQAFKILDRNKTFVRFNQEWLSKLTFADVIKMASNFTVQQFLARDRLRNRWEMDKPLWLSELLYPLAQGYDAVHLRADVQLGGREQLFNLMAARKLQEVFGQKPQICITFPVLVGIDGTQRMSKSLGNYISVYEPPEEIYGKVMSITDSLIMDYFELLTNVPAKELAELRQALADDSVNPMELKKRLASDIVTQLDGPEASTQAEEHFSKTVQKKETPDEIEEKPVSFRGLIYPDGNVNVGRLLTEIGLAKSVSEANRLIGQGGTVIDDRVVTNRMVPSEWVESGSIIKVGKRRFAKVINSDTLSNEQ